MGRIERTEKQMVQAVVAAFTWKKTLKGAVAEVPPGHSRVQGLQSCLHYTFLPI